MLSMILKDFFATVYKI